MLQSAKQPCPQLASGPSDAGLSSSWTRTARAYPPLTHAFPVRARVLRRVSPRLSFSPRLRASASAPAPARRAGGGDQGRQQGDEADLQPHHGHARRGRGDHPDRHRHLRGPPPHARREGACWRSQARRARKRDARANATHATRNPATTRLSLRARARGSEIARAATATRHNAAHAATAYGNHLARNTARPRERGSTRASKPESCALAG